MDNLGATFSFPTRAKGFWVSWDPGGWSVVWLPALRAGALGVQV
jgi:hypothetical protein